MRERPILFSSPMVRALLAGTKTQTRRAGKPVRHPDLGNLYDIGALVLEHEPQHVIERACPYGQPGDRLWVRERFALDTKGSDAITGTHYESPFYWADADDYGLLAHDGYGPVYTDDLRWRPSIHMPRWASRILLEITGVRVERLQDISEKDAQAEGAERGHLKNADGSFTLGGGSHRCGFINLWQTINGPGSWDANPFVWCVEFKRVTQ